MAELKDLSIEEFAALAASDAPAPGGGSVSAVAGALAAALAEKEIAAKGAEIRKTLVDDIERDSESFTLYMKALGMPKDTEEQKAVRREAMQNGLKEAARVPLSVARTAAEIFPLAEAVIARGNTNAVTDGLVAAMMARTAVIGALFNVKINLGSIKDEEFRAEMEKEVSRLEAEAVEYEKRILKSSELSDSLC